MGALRYFLIAVCAGNSRIGLDPYIHLGAFLKPDFLTIVILQGVRHSNLAVKMICTFDRNLSLLRFTALRVRMNDFLDFPWKRSACFGLF